MNILVTSGATREAIDKVRFITNLSTGRTGAVLADELKVSGHEVTYLHGEGAALPSTELKREMFKSFRDLDEKVKNLVNTTSFDVVIHAAAVSDYSVENVTQYGEFLSQNGKIDSKGSIEIKLTPNFKILNRIKDYSGNKSLLVVGFKLTYTIDPKEQAGAVERLFGEGSVDLVVHNDLLQIEETKEHQFNIYDPSKKVRSCRGPQELAKNLNELFKARTSLEEIL